MVDIPDILGFELDEAEDILEDMSLDYYVRETKPTSGMFKDRMSEDTFRVIRVREVGERLEVTVCKI